MEPREFMQGVKQGDIRGEAIQHRLTDNVVIELSVASFEYGHIHVRILVDEPELDAEEGTYFNHLYPIDDDYEQVHDEIITLVEAENETAVRNDYMWESSSPSKAKDFPWLPDDFNPETTTFFEDYAQLRDDVTIIEALETNRTDDYPA